MEQLNQIYVALMRRWDRLSSRQRRRLRVGVVASGLVIAIWGVYQATPRYEMLLSGRTFLPRELTAIESALAQAGLDSYEIHNGQVRVPRERRAAYIGALAERDALPFHFDLELKDELSRSSAFESQEQRRARLQTTQQRELARILRAMKGIEDATVQLDASSSGPFQRQRQMTAMVVVRPQANKPLDIGLIRSIRHLVASSKVDLKPQDVTVTDLETGMSYAGTSGDPALLRSDEFAVRKITYQRDWQEKITRLLGHIPGVQVAVNVDLQYEKRAAEGPAGSGIAEATTVLVPSTVGVAIGIPERFYDVVYREHRRRLSRVERAQESDDSVAQIRKQQNERVTSLVRQVLPADAAVNIAAVRDATETTTTAGIWNWFRSAEIGWQSVALALVSLSLLVLLGWSIASEPRSEVTNSSLRESSHEPSQNVSAGERQALVTDGAGQHRPIDRESPREETPNRGEFHQELTRIVRQDPDAAAAKLAEWIEKAA